MKLCNAPERKRKRQLGALDRLKANANRRFYVNHLGNMVKINHELAEREIKVLEERAAFQSA